MRFAAVVHKIAVAIVLAVFGAIAELLRSNSKSRT